MYYSKQNTLKANLA
ncbi:hypothetical protein ACQSMR_003366 [Morganella morganii]